jgi:hypothetical protein
MAKIVQRHTSLHSGTMGSLLRRILRLQLRERSNGNNG